MPHPWFQMLQDEEAEAEAAAPADDAAAPADAAGGDVVFPDDYPNSVKHFLMLGAVGLLIGAIVFITLNFMRAKRSTAHSVRCAHLRPLPARACAARPRGSCFLANTAFERTSSNRGAPGRRRGGGGT
jgi:hypothetical protein